MSTDYAPGDPLQTLRNAVARGVAEHGAIVEQPTMDALIERARTMGAEHGKSAASWYFDGNTTLDAYAAVLKGIEDGDPAILDTFPSSPLSGEWADDPTPATVLEELGVVDDDASVQDTLRDSILDAYEDGFYSASAEAIERVARYHAEPDEDDDDCPIMVEVDGPPAGEKIGACKCGRPVYRSLMAGTIYHATEDGWIPAHGR